MSLTGKATAEYRVITLFSRPSGAGLGVAGPSDLDHTADRRRDGTPEPAGADRLVPGREAASDVPARVVVEGRQPGGRPGVAGDVVGEVGEEAVVDAVLGRAPGVA